MPCNSDYMEPTGKEKRLQQTAKLYVFVCNKLNMTPSNLKAVRAAANDPYCNLDVVPDLCRLIRSMSRLALDEVVYNARDKTSRELADWWEEHEAADRRRATEEERDAENAKIKAQALKKLTKKERDVLGLKDEGKSRGFSPHVGYGEDQNYDLGRVNMIDTFFFNTKGSVVDGVIDAPVFAVKAFETGFYPIYTGVGAARLNHGTPDDVLKSALKASMFGWDVPAAERAIEYLNENGILGV